MEESEKASAAERERKDAVDALEPTDNDADAERAEEQESIADEMAADATVSETTVSETTGFEATGSETTGSETTGSETTGSETTGSEQESPVAEPVKSAATTVPTLEAAPARKSAVSTLIAVLALLVALAAAAATGWLFYQSQQASGDDADQAMSRLEAELNREVTALREAAKAQQQQAAAELGAQLGSQRELQQQLEQRASDYDQRLAALQAGQNSQRERLLQFATTDRSDWMLAEAEYLLRLANQRIIMAADVRSAKALLQSADQILLELDAADLLPVRAAIATDLAALRAVPAVDVEGTWLRLQALTGQIDALRLFEVPEQEPLAAGPAPSGDWRARLQQGLDAVLALMSRYIVINRRETPYEPLMGPQWEQLVRQNMRMLMEQSRAALMSGNQQLYQLSLSNARFWLAEFFNQDTVGVAALDLELQALAEVRVSRNYPDISASMMTVKSVINARHMSAGGN